MGEEEKSHTDVFIRQTTFLVFLTQALGAECTRKEMEFTSSKRAQGSVSMPSRQEGKLRLPLSSAGGYSHSGLVNTTDGMEHSEG